MLTMKNAKAWKPAFSYPKTRTAESSDKLILSDEIEDFMDYVRSLFREYHLYDTNKLSVERNRATSAEQQARIDDEICRRDLQWSPHKPISEEELKRFDAETLFSLGLCYDKLGIDSFKAIIRELECRNLTRHATLVKINLGTGMEKDINWQA